MPRLEQFENINNAAKAHTDLNVFASIVSILEGGHISPKSYKTAQRIIDICKSAQTRCLKAYDKAVEDAGGGTYGKD